MCVYLTAGLKMKKAFTLTEIMIVVAILGILVAIAFPHFQDHALKARETAAKDNLRMLRNAINLFAAQHNDTPPGYTGGNTALIPATMSFELQLTKASNILCQTAAVGTPGYDLGPYFTSMPKNPFNGHSHLTIVANNGTMPAAATGTTGWIYKAATKPIRLDWPGTDSKGVVHYEY